MFLTQDNESADLAPHIVATVLIFRVPQAIPITRRVELWEHAVDDFLHPIPGRLFEVLGDGRVVAWDFRP